MECRSLGNELPVRPVRPVSSRGVTEGTGGRRDWKVNGVLGRVVERPRDLEDDVGTPEDTDGLSRPNQSMDLLFGVHSRPPTTISPVWGPHSGLCPSLVLFDRKGGGRRDKKNGPTLV